MVIWLVGLSGVGKTTISSKLAQLYRESGVTPVLVDGDIIRSLFKQENVNRDYTIPARRLNAERIIEICSWLEQQGVCVICSIQCIFDDLMIENQTKFKNYTQIELVADIETLKSRDTRGYYDLHSRGLFKNIVGIDIPYARPSQSDLVISTDSDLTEDEVAKKIYQFLSLGVKK